MNKRVTPMIHVPDVRSTVDWYRDIGFTVNDTYSNEGDGLSFAVLSFGTTQVMFNQGGQPSSQHRREVDLYVYADRVDDLFARLKDRVDVVEGPHDTFYGMREFIIRDINRFWITFGQATAYQVLMNGVRERKLETVRAALEDGVDKLKPEMLSAALFDSTAADYKNAEIAELLRQAGAVMPPVVDAETLRSYLGRYKSEQGFEINITLQDGTLIGAAPGEGSMRLIAINRETFRPVAYDAGTIEFKSEAGKTTGAVLTQNSLSMPLKRVLDSST